MPRSPGLRKWTEYLRPGLCGMPLALSLSEGLGGSARLSPLGSRACTRLASTDCSFVCLGSKPNRDCTFSGRK
jgi:hypothetical protein